MFFLALKFGRILIQLLEFNRKRFRLFSFGNDTQKEPSSAVLFFAENEEWLPEYCKD